ncbi:MAG TPA: protease inhibitor I42 family protein [Nitrososphaeraceae archaeon]|nr:protease inhibitor I42 family protein [Nitrososphaeraceae archaeon]
MNQILVDQNQKNETFHVKMGDIILINLNENPTTGYQWKIDESDEKIIPMEDSKYSISSHNGIGSGDTRTFTFRPQSFGKAKVQLSLQRMGKERMSC